jgi:hypothetical protein
MTQRDILMAEIERTLEDAKAIAAKLDMGAQTQRELQWMKAQMKTVADVKLKKLLDI